jgi:hypothetical protein
MPPSCAVTSAPARLQYRIRQETSAPSVITEGVNQSGLFLPTYFHRPAVPCRLLPVPMAGYGRVLNDRRRPVALAGGRTNSTVAATAIKAAGSTMTGVATTPPATTLTVRAVTKPR